MSEPSIEVYHGRTLANRILTLVAATRPAFLSASVLPVLAAGALVRHLDAQVSVPRLMLAVVCIVLIHAGANVLNDYFDGVSGNDALNVERIFPFSGGSRFIQNGVLTLSGTRALGASLLAAGGLLGLVATFLTGPLLLAIGITGGLIAVIYSAPPCLACRGLGDVAIGITFGLLPVAGSCLMLMGSIPPEAWWTGAAIGCHVAAILWANSIPDIAADRASGKLTLPVRLGAAAAARALPLWFVGGALLLIASPLPRTSWIALAALVPGFVAGRAAIEGRLAQALPVTILTHAVVSVLLIAGLLAA